MKLNVSSHAVKVEVNCNNRFRRGKKKKKRTKTKNTMSRLDCQIMSLNDKLQLVTDECCISQMLRPYCSTNKQCYLTAIITEIWFHQQRNTHVILEESLKKTTFTKLVLSYDQSKELISIHACLFGHVREREGLVFHIHTKSWIHQLCHPNCFAALLPIVCLTV